MSGSKKLMVGYTEIVVTIFGPVSDRLDKVAAAQGLTLPDLAGKILTQYAKRAAKGKGDELDPSQVVDKGKRANSIIEWFANLYAQKRGGEIYAGAKGLDNAYVQRTILSVPGVTSEEIARRLTLYLEDAQPFLVGNGHALVHFKWNAYSPAAMELKKKGAPNRRREPEGESPAARVKRLVDEGKMK